MSATDKHGKASKAGRNYRTNGAERGSSPSLAASTKYVRSGGPGRAARRKAITHGCGIPAMHMGKRGTRDFAHSHFTPQLIVLPTVIADPVPVALAAEPEVSA